MCGSDAQPPADSYKTPACLEPTPAATAKRGDLVVERFPLTFDGYTYLHGHISYIKGRPPAPVILVHHNYAGLKQFDIDQASFLAKVGYVGLAVDLYKESENYKFADRNKGEFHVAGPIMNGLYLNPKHWRALLKAYLEAAFAHPAVAKGLAGAIGYCLGGQSCLEQLRDGQQVQALVTFHGLLQSRPWCGSEPGPKMTQEEYLAKVDVPPTTCTPGCRLVVENGSHDGEVPVDSIMEWVEEMDKHEVNWQFHNHARMPHGFALAPGSAGTCYREEADRRSTMWMLSTFAETWPEFKQHHVEMNACGTKIHNLLVPVGGAKGKGKAKSNDSYDAATGKGSGKGKKGSGKGQGGGKGKPVWRVKASA